MAMQGAPQVGMSIQGAPQKQRSMLESNNNALADCAARASSLASQAERIADRLGGPTPTAADKTQSQPEPHGLIFTQREIIENMAHQLSRLEAAINRLEEMA